MSIHSYINAKIFTLTPTVVLASHWSAAPDLAAPPYTRSSLSLVHHPLLQFWLHMRYLSSYCEQTSPIDTCLIQSLQYLSLDMTQPSELALNPQFTTVTPSVLARTQQGAVVVSSSDSAMVTAGSTNIYVTGGINSAGTTQNDYLVATITSTGTLTFASITCAGGCYSAPSGGYCMVASNSEISLWGASMNTGGIYSTIGLGGTTLTSGATSTAVMNVARTQAACTASRGVQYISGGTSLSTIPSNGVQYRLA